LLIGLKPARLGPDFVCAWRQVGDYAETLIVGLGGDYRALGRICSSDGGPRDHCDDGISRNSRDAGGSALTRGEILGKYDATNYYRVARS